MAGLLDSLSSASRSLSSARLGLEVAGQNLANVNTAGYSRRSLTLAEVPPVDVLNAGRGVQVVGIDAHRDELVLARLWNEQQQFQFDRAVVDGLTEVESAIGLPGQSLDERLTAFFDAFRTLADDPTSLTGRDNVVAQGVSLTRAFHELSARLTDARRGADAAIAASVEEVNQLARRVAELNEAIAAGGSDVEALRDARDQTVARLTDLAAVGVARDADGSVTLSVGAGRPLVVGSFSYALTTTTTPPLGLTSLAIGDFDLTAEITGGQIGGLLHLRDTIVPGYATRLDDLAYSVASAVNGLHVTGFDGAGNAAGVFFATLGGAAGSAAAIAVDAAVAVDSRLVASSSTGAIGDNVTARALAALRDAPFASGGTATAIDAWSQLAYRVGADLGAAKSSVAGREDVVRQLEQLRAQVSGVSMDEEAANLVRFQRAYEANARYFTTITDLLDTLMDMVR